MEIKDPLSSDTGQSSQFTQSNLVNQDVPNKNSRLIGIISIVIISIFVGYIGVFVYIKYSAKSRGLNTDMSVFNDSTTINQNQMSEKSIATSTQTQASVKTVVLKDWKTYKNNDIPLVFQYPNDWNTVASSDNSYITIAKNIDGQPNNYGEVVVNNNSISLKGVDMSTEQIANYKKEIDTKSNISIGGIKAIKEIYANDPFRYQSTITFIVNNKVVSFSYLWFLGGVGDTSDFNKNNNKEAMLKVVDQIVSTFQFN